MRRLVACPSCKLQYDAGALEAGDRFRCGCGELVRVPEARPHDAAVVRCASCGAPRQEGSSACTFCGSDFTLHERDLHTLCPACVARISDRARFCHGCGQPIAPQAIAGEPTERGCPVCGPERRLTSRPLEGQRVAALECPRCAGLWLGTDLFRVLEEQAQRRGTSIGPLPGRTGATPAATPVAKEPLYRPCILCGKLMHRRNYGRKSGVILDACAAHGLWFDHGELEQVLVWIRAGGLLHAQRQEQAARQAEARRQQLPPTDLGDTLGAPAGRGWIELIRSLVDFLTG